MSESYPHTPVEVTDYFGITRRALNKWVTAGCPCYQKSPRKRFYRISDIETWLEEQGRTFAGHIGGDKLLEGHLGGPDATPEEQRSLKDQLLRARIDSTIAQAVRHRIVTERLRGTLVEAEEVERGRLARVSYLRGRMLGMPSYLSPDLVGQTEDVIAARLRAWVLEVLEEFARPVALKQATKTTAK